MSKVLRINNNFLHITDDVTGIDLIRSNRKNIGFEKSDSDVFRFFYELTGLSSGSPNYLGGTQTAFPFADLIDYRTGSAFTSVSELEDYLSQYLGNICCGDIPEAANLATSDLTQTSTPRVYDINGGIIGFINGKVGIGVTPTAGLLHMEGPDAAYLYNTATYGIGVFAASYFGVYAKSNAFAGGIAVRAEADLFGQTAIKIQGITQQYAYSVSNVNTITTGNELNHEKVVYISDAGDSGTERTFAYKDLSTWKDIRTGFDITEIRGFPSPKLTAAQAAAISSPQQGEFYFQTDGTTGFYVFNGASWERLAYSSEI